MKNAPPPALKGFIFGECLGRGGMASVWKAKQLDTGRVVAVKILDRDLSSTPNGVEDFYKEAKTAAALDHPNIVTVFEVGCHSGSYYCVMELAEGYDTAKWLARKGHLAEFDVLTVAESVGVALEYAVKAIGMIHCDIKPSNIVVDGDGTVRITDMGLARVAKGGGKSEYIFGTPCFMSPEQARGVPDLDERADIYSLGATIYHLLSGHALFEKLPDERVLEMQCTGQVDDIRTVNPAVSAPCAVMISRFLAKRREDRPENWHAALGMIRGVLAADEAASRGERAEVPPELRRFGRLSTMKLRGESFSRARERAREKIRRRRERRERAGRRAMRQPWAGYWFWVALASAGAFLAAFIVARSI